MIDRQINQKTLFFSSDEKAELLELGLVVKKKKMSFKKKIGPIEKVSSLHFFLKKLQDYKLLSASEEVNYLKLAQQGDLKARDQMICCNLRLVIKFSKQYQGNGLDLLELIQEGVIGLISAIRKFDLNKGTRFSTYACYWVEQSISRALMNTSKMIRLPVHAEKLVNKISKQLRNNENISHVDIAKSLDISAKKVNDLLEIGRGVISYDQEYGENGDGWVNMFFDENANVEDEVGREQLSQHLFFSIQLLNKKHQSIIIKRFGLNDEEPKTLEEIGKELNLSKERVRQIIQESFIKMKKSLSIDLCK